MFLDESGSGVCVFCSLFDAIVPLKFVSSDPTLAILIGIYFPRQSFGVSSMHVVF